MSSLYVKRRIHSIRLTQLGQDYQCLLTNLLIMIA